MNINKQQAMVSAEFMGHELGRLDYLHYKRQEGLPEKSRNKFHCGGRCWFAFERGYVRAWLQTAQDEAFKELAALERRV